MSQLNPVSPDEIAKPLAEALLARGWRMATAESCTGGQIAAHCTDLAGSSAWFERGVVSYSNEAKVALLGVPEGLIAEHGAVSEPVARAMAEGLLARAPVELVIAVTGIAGPAGGTPDKPVGLVWMAWAVRGQITQCERQVWPGDRASVRQHTTAHALLRAGTIVAASADMLRP